MYAEKPGPKIFSTGDRIDEDRDAQVYPGVRRSVARTMGNGIGRGKIEALYYPS